MANIIQQFKNAGGDNIYPVAYAQGGMKMDLLWTNPSPTSSFSTQTVSIDLSGYSMVVISCYVANSLNTELLYNIGIVGTSVQMQPPIYNGALRSRTAIITTSGITFGSGIFWQSYNNTSSSATQDVQCVPYQVYGIKMSYIVPTNVHGIQYVEV